jgi:hypothetical protein
MATADDAEITAHTPRKMAAMSPGQDRRGIT